MTNNTIQKIVSQIAFSFTVKDIMIPASDLVRAKGVDDAKAVLKRCPDFDIIPLPYEGEISGYYRRGTKKSFPVTPTDLISDGTSLIHLPDLLVDRDFFFILSSNMISGFVHFSDLNNSMVKLPLFALFEALERNLWSLIVTELNTEDFLKVSNKKRVKAIEKKLERNKENDVDLGWSGILFFSEILRFAVHKKKIKIPDDEIDILVDTRNRIAHTDRLLVSKHDDTRKLVQVKKLCLSFFEAQTISNKLQKDQLI